MEENKKQRNNKILKACGILGLFLIVFGVTYALFRVTLNGTKKNRITTGTLSLRLLDENDNYIDDLNPNADTGYSLNLTNAVPEIYDDAIAREDNIYTFKLKNEGTINAKYDISLEDLALEAGESRLADDFVAYEIERLVNDSNPEQYEFVANGYNLTDLTDRIITTGIIAPQETYVFKLRLWIDDETVTEENQAEAMNKVFNARLKVNGVQTNISKELSLTFNNLTEPVIVGSATASTPTFDYANGKSILKGNNITVTAANDSATYTVDITNNGLFDVKISEISDIRHPEFLSCSGAVLSGECEKWNLNGDNTVSSADKINIVSVISGITTTGKNSIIKVGETKTITIKATIGDITPIAPLALIDGDLEISYERY